MPETTEAPPDDTTAPSSEPPESSVPEPSTPETSEPVTSVPETSMPEDSLPAEPEDSVPSTEAPMVADMALTALSAPAPTCSLSVFVRPGARFGAACVETRLRQLGYSTGPIGDNLFDTASVAALRQFQADEGITAHGIADHGTLAHLGLWNPPGAAPSCRVNLTVRGGMSAGVACVETRLRQLGLYTGSIGGALDAPGQNAIAWFQHSAGLPVTYVADPATLVKLGVWSAPNMVLCWVSTPVRLNSTVGAQCVEHRLRQLGVRTQAADGTFDSAATAQIRQVQVSAGIPLSYVADKATLQAMGLWREPPTVVCRVSTTVRPTSAVGSRCVETRLQQLGFSTGPADDYFDTQSAIALERYQFNVGLPVNHIADKVVLQSLGIWTPPNPYPVPANSGTGRRIVYSRPQQRIWLVNEDGSIYNTHRVSGRLYEPYAGTYYVYSRSMYTYSANDPSVRWRYMVRFTYGPDGGRIGFHEIPNRNGVPLQTAEQLGLPLSGGCVRQTTADAIIVWNWAPIGTKVVVL